MGRKGDVAKATVLNKIKQIYPDAIYNDKKLYVMEQDEGEMVQIAIAMTMPKNAVTSGEKIPVAEVAPWEGSSVSTVVQKPQKEVTMEITQEEQEMINKLMEELGITE